MRNRDSAQAAPSICLRFGCLKTNQIFGLALVLLAVLFNFSTPSYSRSHKRAAATQTRHAAVSHRATSSRSTGSRRSTRAITTTTRTRTVARTTRGRGRSHTVVSYAGNKRTISSHRGRHQRGRIISHEVVRVVRVAPRTRYAYPLSFFLMHPPEFDRSSLPLDVANKISKSFHQGYADSYAARSLVRAGIVSYHPLRGGIFWRREPVKYIVMHSTETGIPLSAQRVIESWSSSGRRHAGAQYVVERDGTIFQAVDPDLGTVHINIFKTLPGINNDNSIGIEMCHTGRQDYPAAQRESVIKLVAYLQERYKVLDENVITHRYAQQGDHTDPVNFDWDGFITSKNNFRNRAIAYKVRRIKDEVKDWTAPVEETPPIPNVREYNFSAPSREASTFLQPHTKVLTEPVVPILPAKRPVAPMSEPTMILIPPQPDGADRSNVAPQSAPQRSVTPQSAPPQSIPPSSTTPVLPRNAPALRGPIEMAPQAAPGLNASPIPGPTGTP